MLTATITNSRKALIDIMSTRAWAGNPSCVKSRAYTEAEAPGTFGTATVRITDSRTAKISHGMVISMPNTLAMIVLDTRKVMLCAGLKTMPPMLITKLVTVPSAPMSSTALMQVVKHAPKLPDDKQIRKVGRSFLMYCIGLTPYLMLILAV